MGTINPDEGFIQNGLSERSCTGASLLTTEPVGFCLAGGTTETTISFGGRREFSDVTDFIVYIFRFSFSIAIALAVIMILVSGIQWMSSGGNSSIIEDAKKRILNTVLGLFLLSMSYVLLDTINPALVRLRPLDIYLLNPIELAPEFCRDIRETPLLFAATRPGSDELLPLSSINTSQTVSKERAQCGDQFYIQNAGEQTCRGDLCTSPQGSFCAPKIVNNDISTSEYECTLDFRANISLDIFGLASTRLDTIGGNIVAPFFIDGTTLLFEKIWIGDNAYPILFCKENFGPNTVVISKIDRPDISFRKNIIPGNNSLISQDVYSNYFLSIENINNTMQNIDCNNNQELLGFAIHIDLNGNLNTPFISWDNFEQSLIRTYTALTGNYVSLIRSYFESDTMSWYIGANGIGSFDIENINLERNLFQKNGRYSNIFRYNINTNEFNMSEN
jgi:hypothetical protein